MENRMKNSPGKDRHQQPSADSRSGILNPHELLGIRAGETDPVVIVEAACVRLGAIRSSGSSWPRSSRPARRCSIGFELAKAGKPNAPQAAAGQNARADGRGHHPRAKHEPRDDQPEGNRWKHG
jgi:hypothetical protein